MRRLRVVFIAVLPLAAFSQATNPLEGQIESEAASRVTTLEKRSEELMGLTDAEKEWVEACRSSSGCAAAAPGLREKVERAGEERKIAADALAAQVHSEIDAYISRAVRPDYADPSAITQSLKRILGKAADNDPPVSAFWVAVNRSRCLFAAYTLHKGTLMGPGTTSVTIRAYAPVEGRFRLAAATGEDMDGYARVSPVQLRSPKPGEMWVLLSGYMTGANGPNNEMRVYAFDGTRFKQVWGPDDNWGTFTVRVTDSGFAVDGDYYTAASGESRPTRHDVYRLAEDGVHRVSP